MIKNPFKFGSIVNDPYFTNRTAEIGQVTAVLNSSNHLILISPRRYGKSSLVYKVIQTLHRPVIAIDLQLITSVEDMASQLLKRIYRIYPAERIKQFIRNFRIIPTVSLNPVTNEVDIAIQPSSPDFPMLEDVLNLIEKLSSEKKRVIVVMDEFQEVGRLDTNLVRQLRSVVQHHQHVNYVFLGSQESMIREIFEKKKSPFYHFGFLLTLSKINRSDFRNYLESGLRLQREKSVAIADDILDFTKCHPYYTQQLAFSAWEILSDNPESENSARQAIDEIIQIHDMDYERLWGTFNNTDKKLLIGMSESGLTPLSEAFYRKYDMGSPSTVFSSLKRIMKNGYITKLEKKYEIDDPFFSRWIAERRNA
jgi:AAA+ ATPase superfamily predicted ATPase